MKEPLDELLVQACAAQQQADLAALEQLEPANVPMPFVPQVRRTPRRLLKTVIIAAVCVQCWQQPPMPFGQELP